MGLSFHELEFAEYTASVAMHGSGRDRRQFVVTVRFVKAFERNTVSFEAVGLSKKSVLMRNPTKHKVGVRSVGRDVTTPRRFDGGMDTLHRLLSR